MAKVETVTEFLGRIAPLSLAEDWDNVGLLVGDPDRNVQRVMTCLTVTPNVVAEAVERKVDLLISHHPMPFHALKRLTPDTPPGRMLLELIAARVAVYSAHTAFDSAANGINQRLARGLDLRGVFPLVFGEEGLGAGRIGWIETPAPLAEVAENVKQFLNLDTIQIVGDPEQTIRLMAVTCGAAGSFLEKAREAHCDGMLLGETHYHTYLEAEAYGIGLILPGHYASERFGMECLADVLTAEFSEIDVWASHSEYDPVRVI